jgi:hypothetical protein
MVEQFWLSDGHGQPAGGSHDTHDNGQPFERPSAAGQSTTDWITLPATRHTQRARPTELS